MAIPPLTTPRTVLLQAVDAIARARAQIREMADTLRQLDEDAKEAEVALAHHSRSMNNRS